jgi:hypothetical protein
MRKDALAIVELPAMIAMTCVIFVRGVPACR